mgnify:CR=1 FL=1
MIPWSVKQDLKELALSHAEQVRSSRHAAIISYKGNQVSWGVNRYKTHPIMLQYQRNEQAIFLHAETDAIKNALKERDDLSRCSLYVLRIKKDDDRKTNICGIAKPCIGCMKAISTFGIKSVKYTLDNNGYGVL